MMENQKLEIDNSNPFTLLEIEELVTEETKHNQQQPKHLVWDWGAGDRGNKTQPTIGDWGAGDRGNKQPTTPNSHCWTLRSWWQSKNTTNNNQITNIWKTTATNNHHFTMMRLMSWSQRNKTTTKKQFTKMEIGELVTEGNDYHQQPFLHNVGDWGAGDRRTQPLPTKINSQWWRWKSWWLRKNQLPPTDFINNDGDWGAGDRGKSHHQQQIISQKIIHNQTKHTTNTLNTNPNNGDWKAGDRGIISSMPIRLETIRNHGPTWIGCMSNNNDVEALCTPPTTNHS